MQEVSHVSDALNDRRVGRWAVALAATAFMVGGGYLGSVGSAQAGDEPDSNNVGSPGRDGQSVTCYVYTSPRDDAPICNAVGGDGEDGAPAVVHR
jgi:hypothetical protein